MYWIKQFGATVLPTQGPDQFVGVGKATADFLPLSGGGVYDSLGSGIATLQGTVIPFRGTISAASQTETALETQYYALRALFGKRDLLYRQRSDTETWEWCVARVVNVSSQRRIENLRMLDVSLDFQMISPTWFGARHGAGWTLDSGEYFDTGLVLDEGDDVITLSSASVTGTVSNGGSAAVRNCEVIFSPPGGYLLETPVLERLVSGNPVEKFTVDVDIPYGCELTVDCGRFTVVVSGPAWQAVTSYSQRDGVVGTGSDGVERFYKCNTVLGDSGASEPTWPTTGTVVDGDLTWEHIGPTDQYDSLSLGAEHQSANWLTLEAGSNSIRVSHAGTNGGTADFNFYDGWV